MKKRHHQQYIGEEGTQKKTSSTIYWRGGNTSGARANESATNSLGAQHCNVSFA